MASQVYFQGHFWDCIEATAPGETPATTPAKWRRIDLPRDCQRYVPQAAFALLLDGDGQGDKRLAAERRAEALLKESFRAMSRTRTHPNTLNVVIR